jgi:predicted metal-binding membrane protein
VNGNTRAVRLSVAAQQRVLWLGVAIATAASWMYVLRAMRGHAGVHPKGMLPFAVPMWAAMMLGMMLPTAAPMFATYAAVARRDGQRYVSCLAAFVSAYLAVWIAFSIAGAWIQAGLASAGLVSAMGAASRPVGAGLLILSGAYQFTAIKHACLARCRTPLAFLMAEWRPGSTGAARLGLIHGRDCVLCCWAIMTLMFVVGLMNLWWMGMLTVLMLVEKAAPHGDRVARVAGMVMIACGGGLLYAG